MARYMLITFEELRFCSANHNEALALIMASVECSTWLEMHVQRMAKY